MPPISVILFDFGRTLCDIDNDFFNDAYAAILKRHDYDCAPDAILAAARAVWSEIDSGDGADHAFDTPSITAYDAWREVIERQVLATLGVPDPSTALIAELFAMIDQPDARYTLYDDVLPMLDALRSRGLRLGIVSNFGWRLDEIVASVGLDSYMEHVLTSARAGYRKPHTAIFSQALDAFAIKPQQILFVGDSPHTDVFGATRAGMDALLLDRIGAYPSHQPLITSLRELPAWLDSAPSTATRAR